MFIKSKLLDACINGNGDIFAEIKKLRKSKPMIATNMDGEKDDIPGHFRTSSKIFTTQQMIKKNLMK